MSTHPHHHDDRPDDGREGDEPLREWNLDDDTSPASGEDRIVALEAELAQEKARTLRMLADMQNQQRRAMQNERVARQQGVAAVVASVVPVVDHFDMALSQDPAKASTESILSGVRVIRDELLRALASQGVGPISPQPGDLFEPGQHEAISQQTHAEIKPGHVIATYQSGFVLREGETQRVLRPAKVVVAG